MQITTENKIRQTLKLVVKKDEDSYPLFMDMIKTFVEKEGDTEIEGKIENMVIEMDKYCDQQIQIKIMTIKEDKLKLLETTAKVK